MYFAIRMFSFFSADNVLTVVSPVSLLMVGGWGVCAVLVYGSFLFTRTRKRSFVSVSLLLLIILGLVSSHGTVVLDASRSTAVLHTVTFFYPQTHSYPLFAVASATVVSNGDQTDAVQINLENGQQMLMSPFSDMGGKEEAAWAIDLYIRKAHGY